MGWDSWFQGQFDDLATPGLTPGRVVADRGAELEVWTAERVVRATLFKDLQEGPSSPVVGDWVGLRRVSERSMVHVLLPRQTQLRRRATSQSKLHTQGGLREQVLAANVDQALIVSALTEEPNLRRLERYLVAVG